MSKTLLPCSIMPGILWGFTQPSTTLTIFVFWKQCEWCMCTWLGHLFPSPTWSRSQQQQWWKAEGTGARGEGALLCLLCQSILIWDCRRLFWNQAEVHLDVISNKTKSNSVIYDSVLNRDSLFGNACIEEVEVIYWELVKGKFSSLVWFKTLL